MLSSIAPADRPRLKSKATRNQNDWLISVKDNGIGFEQAYAEQVFGLFKRLNNRDFPGTGLGLAICKRIVEIYGGRIWAESKLNVGNTFFFTVPIGADLAVGRICGTYNDSLPASQDLKA
ncbi:MAG: ATP-binding protein [Acidobacteriota bacterium]|nr:ATP-binding protein [Acidobacteriota bacterium]MDQ2843186.1 ATP-binding protein [Acidobacteriota bacterium]